MYHMYSAVVECNVSTIVSYVKIFDNDLQILYIYPDLIIYLFSSTCYFKYLERDGKNPNYD